VAATEPPRDPEPSVEELAAAARLWKKTGRDLKARFGGSSMRPSLAPDSEVVVRCGSSAAVGDIVAYLADGRLVLHRVEAVSARDGTLLTRGDALWLPDLPVRDPESVLGVVSAVGRDGRFAPPPPAPRTTIRRLSVWPFRAALAVSPRAAAVLLGPLVWSRRRTLKSCLKNSWAWNPRRG
jgi:hypothetical protein